MPEIPNVCLKLSNRPENLPVIAQALAGVAQMLGLGALEADNLTTAVAEVCKNVVYHAYDGTEGPLELDIYVLAGRVDVAVSDQGIGIRPHLGERTQPHTGLGLPIVHALTQRVAYTNLEGGGTEVRMQFAMPSAAALEPLEQAPEMDALGEVELHSTVELALAPSALARAVLPRVLRALAQQARFAGESIGELERAAETLAARAGDAIAASHLGVAARVAPGELELRAGPLRAGSALGLLDASGEGAPTAIECTVSDRRVLPRGSGELLALHVRPAGASDACA